MNDQQKIEELLKRLKELQKKQSTFWKEMDAIRSELRLLKANLDTSDPAVSEAAIVEASIAEEVIVIEESPVLVEAIEPQSPEVAEVQAPPATAQKQKVVHPSKSNLERFIGENLINKVGIIITVLGVAIGAKFAIENNYIGPLMRIVLGYLVGLGLLGFAIKLKAKYEDFSAVLLSGALAILYFITYAGYAFYGLYPSGLAFALMVVFTVFAVVAAINYDRQIIALLGLVGAYAVPFLLSSGSGAYGVLFSYMAIINIGILFIAVKKYWKALYRSAFGMTWFIYSFWYFVDCDLPEDFGLALFFSFLFFTIFYLTFLAYKVVHNEQFKIKDILYLLLNSFIFYGFGYTTFSEHPTGEHLLGLFTLGNAVIHFVISLVIYQKKLGDRNLFYFVTGLVLVFLTIAVPVQLDGNWVTLTWALLAVLLFWIGRSKQAHIYEYLSYPLMVLTIMSLVQDWESHASGLWRTDVQLTPFLNIGLLTSLLVALVFGGIFWISRQHSYAGDSGKFGLSIPKISTYALPLALLFVLFGVMFNEISIYWDLAFFKNKTNPEIAYRLPVNDFLHYKQVWLINFALLFFAALSFINIQFIKNKIFSWFSLGFNALLLFIFLSVGLYELSELRESYLAGNLNPYFGKGTFHIIIRYISIGFFGLLLYATYRYVQQEFVGLHLRLVFELVCFTALLWVISSELLHWMDVSGAAQSQAYKLALSILWGVYALLLIGYGIWKRKAHLRIAAMFLFGLTLLKLFFYDIAHLNTISKTIVLVSLGVLLLISSFLYNKYTVFDE